VLATNQWLSEPETVSNFVSNIDISNLNNTTENWILASFGSGKAINSEINILVNKLDVAIGKEFSGDVPTPTGVSLEKSNNLVFEIKDHLGNVRATFSPNNVDMLAGTQTYDVTSLTDYYPFGSIMPGRSFSSNSYRYGFQGQEMDNEIKGVGNSINYKYRMHDPRLGRFFAVDPLAPKYPHNSPYAFSENRVIDAVELEGLESDLIHNPYINAALGDNTLEHNRKFQAAANKIVTVNVGTQAAGVGFKLEAGNLGINAQAQVLPVNLNSNLLNSAGASTSILVVSAGVSAGESNLSEGVSLGNVSVTKEEGEDLSLETSVIETGANADVNKNLSVTDHTATIGAIFGVFSASITADFDAAVEAVYEFGETVKAYFENYLGDQTSGTIGTDVQRPNKEPN
jgi:RHS repeat-associated protein